MNEMTMLYREIQADWHVFISFWSVTWGEAFKIDLMRSTSCGSNNYSKT